MESLDRDGVVEWTAHPAKRRPKDVALVAAVVFLTMGAVLSAFHSVWLTFLSAIILVASVAAFLFPTRYELSPAGIAQSRLGHRRYRRWQDLRRLSVGRDAVLVSPFARPTWLDRHRGIVVLLDGADRTRVVDTLKDRVGGDA